MGLTPGAEEGIPLVYTLAMSAVHLDIPEETLISLKTDAESFARDLKILGAIKLFELGKLSSGRAAQLADVSLVEFLMMLGRYGVSSFLTTEEELRQDTLNA